MSRAPQILLLGAGRVAGPAIRYLLERGVPLTIATDDPSHAEALVRQLGFGRPEAGCRVIAWSAHEGQALAALLRDVAVAISLLPPHWHAAVARHCIDAGVHLVTTSYVSREMEALDPDARRARVALLNEIGLDPGIDHLLAMHLIEAERRAGHELLAFRSLCGGLPASPSVNPWGYKLSWNPLGVLRAARQPARQRIEGQFVELTPEQICERVSQAEIEGVGLLETLANRDAVPYATRYGIEGIPTIQRATLRYPGWAATVRALHALDLLSSDQPMAADWRALLQSRLPGSAPLDQRARDLGLETEALARLEWLGLFEPLPLAGDTIIEALAQRMLGRMSYEPGEQDLVLLRNELECATPAGRQRSSATLVVRGDAGGESAMARTVGLPAAIAAELLLQPALAEQQVGVRLPLDPALYQPILKQLAHHGLRPVLETSAIA
jgi:saccharopine dehydrogenase (NADP+, L-glutamate forming)